jgi:hypothetical protein
LPVERAEAPVEANLQRGSAGAGLQHEDFAMELFTAAIPILQAHGEGGLTRITCSGEAGGAVPQLGKSRPIMG